MSAGAVGWAESGVGFLISCEEQFSRRVLPAYFKHSNYCSFVRQLNMYGFHKIRQNEDSYFHHPHFLRDRPQDLALIKRKPEKKKRMEGGKQQTAKKQRRAVGREDQEGGRAEGKVEIYLLREVRSERKVEREKITENVLE